MKKANLQESPPDNLTTLSPCYSQPKSLFYICELRHKKRFKLARPTIFYVGMCFVSSSTYLVATLPPRRLL